MLSKTAEYALRTVAYLAAAPENLASADELSEHTKVPRRYLHKVLQELARHRIVSSRPGPGGGYGLAIPADKLTILEVVNAVDPLQRIKSCPLGLRSHTKLCPLHQKLDEAYAATEAAFAGVTIDEILKSTGSIIPLCES